MNQHKQKNEFYSYSLDANIMLEDKDVSRQTEISTKLSMLANIEVGI